MARTRATGPTTLRECCHRCAPTHMTAEVQAAQHPSWVSLEDQEQTDMRARAKRATRDASRSGQHRQRRRACCDEGGPHERQPGRSSASGQRASIPQPTPMVPGGGHSNYLPEPKGASDAHGETGQHAPERWEAAQNPCPPTASHGTWLGTRLRIMSPEHSITQCDNHTGPAPIACNLHSAENHSVAAGPPNGLHCAATPAASASPVRLPCVLPSRGPSGLIHPRGQLVRFVCRDISVHTVVFCPPFVESVTSKVAAFPGDKRETKRRTHVRFSAFTCPRKSGGWLRAHIRAGSKKARRPARGAARCTV